MAADSSKQLAGSYTFTFVDMERFAVEAWGELGRNIVTKWSEFNQAYFDRMLRPIPLVITPTLPYGTRIADCRSSPNGAGRLIRVNVPSVHKILVADNNTLLHEMIHQFLMERGEPAGHASESWRREIMRLHKLITGKEIWAGRSKTVRKREPGERKSSVVRVNEPRADGKPSLTQFQIARWPHSAGIDLGRFGATHS